MKLVIDIPDYTYEGLRDCAGTITVGESIVITKAIRNGTPLPKGHGDLKDADAIVNGFDSSDLDNSDPIENYSNACNIINSFPVIVPADKR